MTTDEWVEKLKGKSFDWADYFNRNRERLGIKGEFTRFPIWPQNPDNELHKEGVRDLVEFYISQNEVSRLEGYAK